MTFKKFRSFIMTGLFIFLLMAVFGIIPITTPCDEYDQFPPPKVRPELCAYYELTAHGPLTLEIESVDYGISLSKGTYGDGEVMFLTISKDGANILEHTFRSDALCTSLFLGNTVVVIQPLKAHGEIEPKWYIRTPPDIKGVYG